MSAIVFLHEFGHFIIARLCKVRVLEFSLGFGKKLFGITDKHGTEWQIRLFLFGGFVKMYGDRNIASMPNHNPSAELLTAKDAFINKNVYQRIAIVIAGPVANFLSAILILTILFKIYGMQQTSTFIDFVAEKSPAQISGIKINDQILAINNKKMQNFADVANFIAISTEQQLIFTLSRNNQIININVNPILQERKNYFDEVQKTRFVGIGSYKTETVTFSWYSSLKQGIIETYDLSATILYGVKQLLFGQRSITEINGPVKIAKYSGKTVEYGMVAVLWFVALISINLGIMNLLPVPVLDGGHLLYYVLEAIFGKPIPIKIQEFGNKLGVSFLFFLMFVATYNDILSLFKI
jgi:regulator of sigma E protease